MPRKIYDKAKVIADWKTGEFTVREIAYMHKISPAMVQKLTTGMAKSIATLIDKQVEIKQELAELNEHEVNAFTKAVDERTKHIKFFSDAAVLNVKAAVEKVGKETTQMEHRMLADTILKGRETVLGKAPDTAIQINNSNAPAMTPDAFKQIAKEIINEF